MYHFYCWFIGGRKNINGVLIASGIWYNLQEFNYISSKRIAYFYASKPQPHQFTILVRSIPVSSGISVTESGQNFFTEYHSSTYLSHSVVRQSGKLQQLLVSILCGSFVDFFSFLMGNCSFICLPFHHGHKFYLLETFIVSFFYEGYLF